MSGIGRVRAIRAMGAGAMLAAAVFGSSAGPARACSARIVSSADASAPYNPFEAIDVLQSRAVTIENSSAEDCTFQLGFEPQGTGGGFDYRIRSESGATLAAPGLDPAVAERLTSGVVPAGASHDFAYSAYIPAGQVLPPGSFEQQFGLTLTAAPGAQPPDAQSVVATGGLPLTCQVGELFGVNIAGAGTLKTVDFGELTEGESQRVIVEARSNITFSLEATSLKGGMLAMEEPYQQWRVPYTMSVNGVTVGMPGVIGASAPTTIAGTSFELGFTIGDVSGKRAGLYADEITIEIKPAN